MKTTVKKITAKVDPTKKLSILLEDMLELQKAIKLETKALKKLLTAKG